MKSLVLALALAFAAAPALAQEAKPQPKETVKVCVDVKDRQGQPVLEKNGKVKQRCMTVKKHKKLEDATAVPKK